MAVWKWSATHSDGTVTDTEWGQARLLHAVTTSWLFDLSVGPCEQAANSTRGPAAV